MDVPLTDAGRRRPPYAPAIALGIAAFLIVTGGGILAPTRVDWLMEGDPATHWLGWQFFRHTPWLQWPPGANPRYGMEVGSSIVFSDSLPLFAFLFKPVSAWLPDAFQYFGLWILLCFVMQTVFAAKLLSLATQDRRLVLLGSLLFTFAPVALWRLQGHYALFGHWLLLAALCLYFGARYSPSRWLALLAGTALVHAYLLVLTGAIWIADLTQRAWRKERRGTRLVADALAGFALTLAVMWAAGYFMLGPDMEGGGLRFYAMNALSPIDPDTHWSRLLPDRPQREGEGEGFAYLGLGMIGLAMVAVLRSLRQGPGRVDVRRCLPLGVMCVALVVYALSDEISVGGTLTLAYPWPAWADAFTQAFRVTGRFFWPVYYVLYLAIFYVAFRTMRHGRALMLSAALLTAQVLDMTPALAYLRDKFTSYPAYSSPLRSPAWNGLARQYDAIVVVLPHNRLPGWMPVARFAAEHGMAVNTGYFARVNLDAVVAARARVTQAVEAGRLDARALYVFQDDRLWQVALARLPEADVAAVVDGVRIVAPGLGDCDACGALVSELSGHPAR